MNYSSLLCPRCQQPLTSNERYCQRCGTYYPQPAPNTGPVFPSYTPYTDTSNQNSPQPGMTGEKVHLPRRKKPKKVLLIVSILFILFLAGGSFWLGRSSATTANKALTTPTASKAVTPTASTPTPTPPEATTDASTPAIVPTSANAQLVTAGTVTKNTVLTCSGCDDPIRVTINTITFDPNDGRMVWTITWHNVSGNEQYFYAGITLQNSSDSKFVGTGSVDNPESDLAAGQAVQLQEMFTFVPIQNTSYTLSTVIHLGVPSTDINFDPLQLTFQ